MPVVLVKNVRVPPVPDAPDPSVLRRISMSGKQKLPDHVVAPEGTSLFRTINFERYAVSTSPSPHGMPGFQGRPGGICLGEFYS